MKKSRKRTSTEPKRQHVSPMGGNTFRIARTRKSLDDILPKSSSAPVSSSITLSPGTISTRVPLSTHVEKKPHQMQGSAVPRSKESGHINIASDKTCKLKPASSKGSGTGRRFIPWCKK